MIKISCILMVAMLIIVGAGGSNIYASFQQNSLKDSLINGRFLPFESVIEEKQNQIAMVEQAAS